MNMANSSTPWQRLESVIRWADMTTNYFGRYIGLLRSESLYQIKSGKNGISHSLARRIVEHFPEISPGWLLTGEGDMFGRERTGHTIPLYAMESLRMQGWEQNDPECHLMMPIVEPCDVAVRSSDEGMSGEVMVGSILFLKKIGVEAIISGGLYVIVSANYVILRRVRIAEQEQMLRLEAANPDFDPMVVSEDQIEALYRVVASMRMY
jgi:hypothetical protein